jgi:hypothetical protein
MCPSKHVTVTGSMALLEMQQPNDLAEGVEN